jgi:prepilin-type N-terminal cleavage/methylation domain-containing protein
VSGGCGTSRRGSRSGFTLVELVMSIAVLAIAGVFLVQVFLSADRLATKASDLDRAVSLCTTAVEKWKAGAVSPGEIAELGQGQTRTNDDGGFDASGWLDADMKPCDPAAAVFEYAVRVVWDGRLYRFTISIAPDGGGTPVYGLEAARIGEPPATS